MAKIVDEAANTTLRDKTEEDGVGQLLSRSCQIMEVGAKGKRRVQLMRCVRSYQGRGAKIGPFVRGGFGGVGAAEGSQPSQLGARGAVFCRPNHRYRDLPAKQL